MQCSCMEAHTACARSWAGVPAGGAAEGRCINTPPICVLPAQPASRMEIRQVITLVSTRPPGSLADCSANSAPPVSPVASLAAAYASQAGGWSYSSAGAGSPAGDGIIKGRVGQAGMHHVACHPPACLPAAPAVTSSSSYNCTASLLPPPRISARARFSCNAAAQQRAFRQI